MLLLARTVEPEVPRGSGKSILGDFVDGRKYARGHFGIFNVLIFTALMGLLLRPLPELMPGFASVVFREGSTGLAWLLSSFGVGAMAAVPMRARVMGLLGTTFRAVPALDALLQGLGADVFGLGPAVIAAGLPCFATSAWLASIMCRPRLSAEAERDSTARR